MTAVDERQYQYRALIGSSMLLGFIALALVGCVSERTAPAPTAEYDGELEVVLAPVGEQAEIGFPWIGAVLPSGELVFGEQVASKWLVRLGVDGAVRGSIGARGDGPGEMGSPNGMRLHSDTLVIGTISRLALYLFDSNGDWIRTLRLPTIPGSSFVLLRGDTVVVSQAIPSPDRFGLPLHAMHDDQIFASFGSEGRVEIPSNVSQMLRMHHILATAPGDSTFWAAPISRYRLEYWTAGGELVKAVDLDRPWFPPVNWERFGDPNAARVAITSLVVDDDGIATVVIGRTKEAVGEEYIDPADAHSRSSGGATESLNRIDYVIEMIDTRDGSVVESIVVTDRVRLRSIFQGGLLFGVRPGPDGVEYPVVLQLPAPFRKDSVP